VTQWFDLADLARAAIKHWVLIVLILLASFGLGVTLTMTQERVYQAKTSLFVGTSLSSANLNKDDIDVGERLALTYADLVRRQPVMQSVVNDLDLQIPWWSLARRVTVDLPDQNPRLIVVTVEAPSGEQAQAIAAKIDYSVIALSPSGAGVSQSFVAEMLDRLRQDLDDQQQLVDDLKARLAETDPATSTYASLGSQITAAEKLIIALRANYSDLLSVSSEDETANRLAVFEEAEAQESPVRPSLRLNVIVSMFLGGLAALGAIYVLDRRRAHSATGSQNGAARSGKQGGRRRQRELAAAARQREQAAAARHEAAVQRRARG
jgi:tyrosine-protein kinase